jgi:hypothetical protein
VKIPQSAIKPFGFTGIPELVDHELVAIDKRMDIEEYLEWFGRRPVCLKFSMDTRAKLLRSIATDRGGICVWSARDDTTPNMIKIFYRVPNDKTEYVTRIRFPR